MNLPGNNKIGENFTHTHTHTHTHTRTLKTENLNKMGIRDFPGGAVVKNPPASAGDTGSSPGPGRSHMPWSN